MGKNPIKNIFEFLVAIVAAIILALLFIVFAIAQLLKCGHIPCS